MIELIAEVATNHGGSVALAKEFIWRFAEAGATFVKFQHTRVRHLRPDDPQYAWFQRAEFSCEQFAELKAECEQAGTKFLTTVYNHQDVPEVASLGLEAIKIGSGEAADPKLADAALDDLEARIMVSTGILRPNRRYKQHPRVDILACVSRYPTPAVAARRFYATDSWRWGQPVGWSDHCIGLEGCLIAIECGARIIEKHVQLPHQARPARGWEATVAEFEELRAYADQDPARFVGRWQYA